MTVYQKERRTYFDANAVIGVIDGLCGRRYRSQYFVSGEMLYCTLSDGFAECSFCVGTAAADAALRCLVVNERTTVAELKTFITGRLRVVDMRSRSARTGFGACRARI